MRTFRLIGMTLLMIMLTVNFTACSDDEEDTSSYSTDIVGVWTIVCDEGWEIDDNGEKDSWKEEDADLFLKFYEDGTGTHADDQDFNPFTWSITDNKLTLNPTTSYYEKEVWNISMKDNTMTLEISGQDFYIKLTCKKK